MFLWAFQTQFTRVNHDMSFGKITLYEHNFGDIFLCNDIFATSQDLAKFSLDPRCAHCYYRQLVCPFCASQRTVDPYLPWGFSTWAPLSMRYSRGSSPRYQTAGGWGLTDLQTFNYVAPWIKVPWSGKTTLINSFQRIREETVQINISNGFLDPWNHLFGVKQLKNFSTELSAPSVSSKYLLLGPK